MRESLRQGTDGAGWDLVAWASDWGFDLDAVDCPVWLCWGDQDETLADAIWLRDHLPDANLVLWPNEGHLAYKPHLPEIFAAFVDAMTPRSA